jgi:serine/threonine protein kinase
VARGSDPTSASDVFSFGATLYDAVEGGPPFPERQNQLALLRLVAEGIVSPPKQAGALTALLMQLLRPEPADRPTMAQASRLLAELAGSKLPATVLAGVPRNPTRPDLVPARSAEAKPAADAAPQPAPTAVAEPPAAPAPSQGVPSAAFLPGGTQLVDRPKPPPDMRKRALLLGAVVLVLVIAGVGIYLASLSSNQNQAGGGGAPASSTSQTQSPAGQHTTTNPSSGSSTAPATGTTVASSGQIDWSAAGQKVLAFYSTSVLVTNPQAGWQMLSPGAQRVYGSIGSFTAYWLQYQAVSSQGEHPVSPNADGSVQVPADVSYGPFQQSQQAHLSLRVVEVGGQLYLDGDTHIPSTSIPPSNGGGANNQ